MIRHFLGFLCAGGTLLRSIYFRQRWEELAQVKATVSSGNFGRMPGRIRFPEETQTRIVPRGPAKSLLLEVPDTFGKPRNCLGWERLRV